MWPFVHKRHSFRFEEELRAVYPHVPIRYEGDGTDRGIDFSLPSLPGLSFSVDLELLIERIHVSPTASEWFAELVRDVCSRYGLKAPVTQSDLAGSPVY
jgi:hypothetical protein